MKIPTLAEILAEQNLKTAKVSNTAKSPKSPKNITSSKKTKRSTQPTLSQAAPTNPTPKKLSDPVKSDLPPEAPPKPKTTQTADFPNLILAPDQPSDLMAIDKTENRLRWLAFYYLSYREHSRAELKQKLLAKIQPSTLPNKTPDTQAEIQNTQWQANQAKIDKILDEFAEKGYQNEHRAAIMLIREAIRKGRGKHRIQQIFAQHKLDLPENLNELITMALQDGEDFNGLGDRNTGIDWFKLAVETRVKKYGSNLPKTPKDKAKQIRFLQYRGFEIDICIQAIKYNLENLADRD